MVDYIVPLLILVVCCIALWRKENAYDLLLEGGKDGLKLLVSIVPSLVLLLTADKSTIGYGSMPYCNL